MPLREQIEAIAKRQDSNFTPADRAVFDEFKSALNRGEVRAADIVDHDVVSTTQGVEVDLLDIVEVHNHVGDVAGKEYPPTIGHDVDVLGDVGAVEEQPVGPGLALNRVVIVARIPHECVAAGAHERQVITVTAIYQVVALATAHRVNS